MIYSQPPAIMFGSRGRLVCPPERSRRFLQIGVESDIHSLLEQLMRRGLEALNQHLVHLTTFFFALDQTVVAP